jgi:Predicted membrane protein
MKKSDYLAILKEHLETKISPDELEDILSDYESFFHAGMEDGKTEEQISAELGPPAFLAKSLLEGREKDRPDQRIAVPEKRLFAFLIDSVIAVVPALVLAFFAGKLFAVTPLLTIAYPSPLIGTVIYSSYPVYTSTSIDVFELTESPAPMKQHVGSDRNDRIGSPSAVIDNRLSPVDSTRDPINPALSFIAAVCIGFYLLYAFVCTLWLKGQTVGKKVMNIYVRKSDTDSVKSGTIIVREVVGKILMNSIPVIPLISLFTMILTRDRKTLHDMLSDTVVADK